MVSLTSLLALAVGVTAVAEVGDGQTCPPIPGNPSLGQAVPMKPENIPKGCSKYEVIVARGTSEPDYENGGKYGVIVGDPIMSNLTLDLPGVQGYPVQYPASAEFETSIAIGATDVATRLISRAAACPDQTFALVGYSQGALVMHYAAPAIPAELYPRIKSINVFGDPALKDSPVGWASDELESLVRSVCIPGDVYCDVNGSCLYDHLMYFRPEYVDAAVEHIAATFQQKKPCRRENSQ